MCVLFGCGVDPAAAAALVDNKTRHTHKRKKQQKIMWDNGHAAVPFIIIALYSFCHYVMAVIMFKELDLRDAGGTYASDVATFAGR